jgi:hypothetical protein
VWAVLQRARDAGLPAAPLLCDPWISNWNSGGGGPWIRYRHMHNCQQGGFRGLGPISRSHRILLQRTGRVQAAFVSWLQQHGALLGSQCVDESWALGCLPGSRCTAWCVPSHTAACWRCFPCKGDVVDAVTAWGPVHA